MNYLLWILLAAAASGAVAAVFAGWLRLPRNRYLVAYVPVGGLIVIGYYLWSGMGAGAGLAANPFWTAAVIVLLSAVVTRNVLGQKKSPRRRGLAYAVDLIWPGVAYGVVDGLLLSVIPGSAALHWLGPLTHQSGLLEALGLGTAAMVASLFVTLVYHLGYPEFRGKSVIWTLVGNGLLTLGFLATGNPLAAVVPHAVMHVVSISHGRETTLQLPPHYNNMVMDEVDQPVVTQLSR